MKLNPVILYRGREFEDYELDAALAAGFVCTNSRTQIAPESLVIGRYSCLPFYRELEMDLTNIKCGLINTNSQHQYIADMKNWYESLRGLTPDTWSSIIEIPNKVEGPFIVKGETNSRKHLFSTHMFAKDRKDIGKVLSNLLDDSLISHQKLYIREWEPYELFYVDPINGLPITKEFRFFCMFGKVLSGAYYWSSHLADLNVDPKELDPDQVPREFLTEVLKKIGNNANAVVIDVAKHIDGRWRVVELNDLQMSGLSENDPKVLYKNMRTTLDSAVGLHYLLLKDYIK